MTFRRNTMHMEPLCGNISCTIIGRFVFVGSVSHIDAKGCHSPVWCLGFCVLYWR